MIRPLIAAVFFSILTTGALAADDPKAAAVVVAEQETVVELVSIDREGRVAVVKAPNGRTLKMNLPKEAQNLDRVKPGDKFTMRYVEALALSLNKGGAASATQEQSVRLAPKGGRPGGAIVDTRQLTTVVTAVDRATRTIAVKGPGADTMSLKVADEVKSFDEIAVGDTIGLTYTEALVMEMIGEVRTAPVTK